MTIPSDATKIDVEGSTVDFYTFIQDDTTYFGFDTSRCGPPDPMVNAVAGLKLIDAPNKRLLMINHKMPMGLFDKIAGDFDNISSIREDGLAIVIFSFKEKVDMNDSRYDASCHG